MDQLLIKPIGVIHSEQRYRYETPRQGVLSGESESYIELLPHMNFEQAVRDLTGFDRIWVIYQFHLNNNWRPLVNPPRHTRGKIGVFATRAPYRPNPVGLSCVKLVRIEGLKVYISESDILDGSPVIDIKPYLPYSDSFPDSRTGWAKTDFEELFKIVKAEKAELQIKWLKNNAGINLDSFARLQLEFKPTDDSRKRISRANSESGPESSSYILAYRTWRIHYKVDFESKEVLISEITSGYTSEELSDTETDKHKDKMLHRAFLDEKF